MGRGFKKLFHILSAQISFPPIGTNKCSGGISLMEILNSMGAFSPYAHYAGATSEKVYGRGIWGLVYIR